MATDTLQDVHIRLDEAKEKYNKARNILLTDLVPERLRENIDFMKAINGLLVSECADSHVSISRSLSSSISTKIISEVFESQYYHPYLHKLIQYKNEYIEAENAIKILETFKNKKETT